MVKSIALFVLATIIMGIAPDPSFAQDKTRQETVAERGADVMPFDLKATTHIFTKRKKAASSRLS